VFTAKSVSFAFGQGTTTDEYWIRSDGAQSAYLAAGIIMHTAPRLARQLHSWHRYYVANTTLMSACDDLASLPQTLRAADHVDKQIATVGQGSLSGSLPGRRRTAQQRRVEFEYLVNCSWNAYAGASP